MISQSKGLGMDDYDFVEVPEPLVSRFARGLRYTVVMQQMEIGNISRDDAKELLSGNLTPGDNTTFVDDSNLLDMTMEEALKVIGIPTNK